MDKKIKKVREHNIFLTSRIEELERHDQQLIEIGRCNRLAIRRLDKIFGDLMVSGLNDALDEIRDIQMAVYRNIDKQEAVASNSSSTSSTDEDFGT